MKCPYCVLEFHSDPFHLIPYEDLSEDDDIGEDDDKMPGLIPDETGKWSITGERCPACNNLIIYLRRNKGEYRIIHPKGIARAPLSPDVPKEFTEDYKEAALVLRDSPKASAALSRRCLQHVLREAGKTKKKDLAEQIVEVMPHLPSFLQKLIDTVRVVGNFAAHPTKSTNTGEIIEVEPGEGELLLDTLEMVFDFYFVQPAIAEKKRNEINAKLITESRTGKGIFAAASAYNTV